MGFHKFLKLTQDKRISCDLRIFSGLEPDRVYKRSQELEVLLAQIDNIIFIVHEQTFFDSHIIAVQNPNENTSDHTLQNIIIGV